MHFFVTAFSGCLLQAGDVLFSSASSLCLLKAHQPAGDKAVTSPSRSFVSSGPQGTLGHLPKTPFSQETVIVQGQ